MDFDKINNIDYIKESLARLDEQFDLVLITEYFWEGIVLLKHMLCADYKMLYKKNTNSRKYEIKPLNDERQAIFDKFHKADILMYNYFNASLHRKIETFGKRRMESEIKVAKAIFSACAKEKIDCSAKKKRESANTKIIKTPRIKLSEYLKLTGLVNSCFL